MSRRNVSSLYLKELLLTCLGVIFLSAAADSEPLERTKASVRKIDIRQAPQLEELARHAREFGNEMYPKICALLLDKEENAPQTFDVTFKPLNSGRWGKAYLSLKLIAMDSTFLPNKTVDVMRYFDKAFIHEMTHTAVQYRRWFTSFWHPRSPEFIYWGESIADYTGYKLIGTNGWWCPECNLQYPHYTSGYTCGGAFLLFLDNRYGTNVIRQLVHELRQGTYTEDLFQTATGKSLETLWKDFQQTPAFRPGANEAQELRISLGYGKGQPPKKFLAKFDKKVDQLTDEATKSAIRRVRLNPKVSSNPELLMTILCYFTQPGGCCEQFLFALRDQDRLPGIGKQDESWSPLNTLEIQSFIPSGSRTVIFRKRGDDSRYHYTVNRASPDVSWQLKKAWRTSNTDEVIEEYRLPQ